MSGPLAKPKPWDLVAANYNEFVVPMFEAHARRGIQMLELAPMSRVLDIACGPGTATALLAEAGHSVEAIDFSPAMLKQLDAKMLAGAPLADAKITTHLMDGQELSFEASSLDGAISMFGLMFFPDRARGLTEMYRVLRPGARGCISSWVPLASVPAIAWTFGAFAEITPPPPADAPPREAVLEDAESLRSEMTHAGFRNIQVQRSEQSVPMLGSTEEFWQMMVKTSAPIALFRDGVSDAEWEGLSARAIAHLEKTRPPELTDFKMSAWLAVGEKSS